MGMRAGNHPVGLYDQVGAHAGVQDASPHRLIQMLLDGLLARLAAATGHIQRGEVAAKGARMGSAITIVDGLRAHLDTERGGQLARDLDALYEYIGRRLVEANLRNDPEAVAEVAALVRSVKSGWDAIGQPPAGAPAQAPHPATHAQAG